jgi:gluconolactonase
VTIAPIPLAELTAVGTGLRRPEDVVVSRDGRVFASNADAAVGEIFPDGSMKPIGVAGGAPNGINITPDGDAIIIANFEGHSLQRLDLASGEVSTLCDAVEGRPLRSANYPIIARDGSIYCSSSSVNDNYVECLVEGAADGFIARIDSDGRASIVADEIVFPNGLALDAEEDYLYCARTIPADVVRFAILADGGLGPAERYGPLSNDRAVFGEAAAQLLWPNGAERTPETMDYAVMSSWGGVTDGVAFDADGNLWVTDPASSRIVAITPELEVVTVVDDPGFSLVIAPTNVTFGGPDLRDVYFGSLVTPYVVKGRSPVPGLPMAHQR